MFIDPLLLLCAADGALVQPSVTAPRLGPSSRRRTLTRARRLPALSVYLLCTFLLGAGATQAPLPRILCFATILLETFTLFFATVESAPACPGS